MPEDLDMNEDGNNDPQILGAAMGQAVNWIGDASMHDTDSVRSA